MTKIGNRGVTLLEILLVIVIISVLAAMLFTGYGSYTKRARDARRRSNLAQIATAIDQYIFDYKHAPLEPPDGGDAECDTSVGVYKYPDCDIRNDHKISVVPRTNWESYTDPIPPHNSSLLKNIVDKGYIQKLPVDPINNNKYFYLYEPDASGQSYILQARKEDSTGDGLDPPIQIIR